MAAIDPTLLDNGIAIVGLSARLPGARNADEFWDNLRNGVESLLPLSTEELETNGVSKQLLKDPNYVPVSGSLSDVEMFDAGYFGFSPKDAAITDPQHRHFLECAVEAFENAGHSTHRFDGSIGVFAGCGMNSYFINNLLTNPEMMRTVGSFLLRHTGNDRDFLPTTVSYKLDLRGPSMAIQTACSTSLVAIHVACQSLLGGECEMALAGGSTILVPNQQGYFYRENEPVSPDGHCRAFEANSAGTVLTSGTGVVVLRRLEDALADGDTIHAVIRGSAVNNDGAGKVGYLAPSVDGHASAVAEALAVADVSADTISYVEAHGTGTRVGDPIEISALTKAFRASSDRKQYCRIGSVKTNIGHLDTAAGIASLIKVVKSLESGQMAPTLHFKKPNPEIDFASSPFEVNAELRDWPRDDTPRRAGVSSLGIGGTNAHVIVEEAPQLDPTDKPLRENQLLVLSAKTKNALESARSNLAQWLGDNPQADLADVAYTLQEGRDYWDHRFVLAASHIESAATALTSKSSPQIFTNKYERPATGVAFMFSGAGAQHPQMARGLYDNEPAFREAMDRCLSLLHDLIDFDLKALMYPELEDEEHASLELQKASRLCPAVVATEWSLAQLWKSWGIEPSGMIGHSLGEYVAACIAGVFTLKDMLRLVVLRGNLIDTLNGGAMLSLPLSESEAREIIGDNLDIAAVNSPGLCVVSGAHADIETLAHRLADMDIDARLIPVNAAGHSRHLDPILKDFHRGLSDVSFAAPTVPYISNVTGTWADEKDVTQPDYWVRHLRGTVRFAEGLQVLIENDDRILLEVGPGQGLCTFARQQATKPLGIVPSMRKMVEDIADQEYAACAFGKLWSCGYPVEWKTLRGEGERRRRIPLPTYPFEHKPYWVEPGAIAETPEEAAAYLEKLESVDEWFQSTGWQDAPLTGTRETLSAKWLVFLDSGGVGQQLVARLKEMGNTVVTVSISDTFYRINEHEYSLAPEFGKESYEQLLAALTEADLLPERIVHLWSLTPDESFRPGSSFLDRNQECGFYSLLFLMQTFGEYLQEVNVVTNGMVAVQDDENILYPEKATLLGPVRVIPREFPDIACRCIDVQLRTTKPSGLMSWVGLEGVRVEESAADELAARLINELEEASSASVIAWREQRRFEERLVPKPRIATNDQSDSFKMNGVYLVTGGLGGLGFSLSEQIARQFKARMVLVSRSEFPAEDKWDEWLSSHGERDSVTQKIHTIRAIRELGADIVPVSADVTDVNAMQAVVDSTAKRFGTINGVLHAAAGLADGVLQTKTKDSAERVFASKLYGTQVLEEVLAGYQLDFFLVFSSTSAIVGLPGQVDYAAANAYLNAFAEQRNRTGKRTIAVDWGIWNGVGGAADLARDIRHEPETPDYVRSTGHPLLGDCTAEGPDLWRWEAQWRTSDLWVLDEHRNQDQVALLPGTGYLEIARAVFADMRGVEGCHIENVAFLQPLVVSDEDNAHAVAFELRRQDSDYQLSILSVEQNIEHATMTLRAFSEASSSEMDLGAIASRCENGKQIADGDTPLTSSQEAQLGFGPRWSCLRAIGFGQNEAFAELQVDPRFNDDFKTHGLHPGLLDIATSFGIPLINGWQSSGAIYVPLAYGSVRIHAPLQNRIFAHITNDPENDYARDVARFGITLTDESGRVLIKIDNYQMRKLDVNSGFGSLRTTSGPHTATTLAGEPTAIESVFLESYENGICLEEGMTALKKTIAEYQGGVTVVSPIRISDWRKRIDIACASNSDKNGITFARPDLDNEYEAPRNQTESDLVNLWQEFLGVDQIGINDDFFELGGHSLVAVRLFAKLKKQWGVDWPISMLFDAPSIGEFAALLSEEIGDVESSDEASETSTTRRHRFLVAMNRGNNSSRAPLFLVAGMFGNVLNLRHLAAHLGEDQPVYALQAKGLYGEDEPHQTFVDAAHDYIAEMKEVQPHGPYMIGGFSGGGVTAFEIAHQLLGAGEEVSALVMLDSIPPHPAWPEPDFVDRLNIQAQRVFKVVLKDPQAWLKRRIRWELEKRGQTGAQPERTPAEFRSDQIEVAFRNSLACYEMRVLPLPLSLFRPPLDDTYKLSGGRCANADGQLMENENWWAPWTSAEVNVQIVPGNHDSMVLEPNVKVLAEHVRKVLDTAQASNVAPIGVSQIDNPATSSKSKKEQGVRYGS